ncbi:MAG: STAS domain-containing protein [Beijerinckiaceae bacterium]|jgi:hypothetical protein|nr:STAS domain-containing protein [Beijerinckiaceae bacterium]
MPLLLPERPHPRDLPAFQSAMIEALESDDGIRIDAGQAVQLPLAWLQLLVSAARTAQARGASVTVLNPSFAFLFSFEALGLDPERDFFTLEYAP